MNSIRLFIQHYRQSFLHRLFLQERRILKFAKYSDSDRNKRAGELLQSNRSRNSASFKFRQ